jgi:hypothetical protein
LAALTDWRLPSVLSWVKLPSLLLCKRDVVTSTSGAIVQKLSKLILSASGSLTLPHEDRALPLIPSSLRVVFVRRGAKAGIPWWSTP